MTDYFHPADTLKYVNPEQIDNLGLRYNYFLNSEEDKKSSAYKFLPKKIKMTNAERDLIKRTNLRQTAILKSLSGIYNFRVIEAAVDWRLIVGLGSGHVAETGMTLHHIYGIPYIPGSAVKGVLSHYVEDEDKLKIKIFGDENNEGDVIFMDAFPVNNVNFTMDIMNPHYPEYYSGEKYPGDWENPKPIKFLTVEKTIFRFIFLSNKPGYLDKILKWIKEVFEYKGIGAKTAVGYGYFNNIDDITKNLKEI